MSYARTKKTLDIELIALTNLSFLSIFTFLSFQFLTHFYLLCFLEKEKNQEALRLGKQDFFSLRQEPIK